MLKLVKYLKPFIWLILIAVALISIQAAADLSLPDYMSRIVNVGIQQSGVENAVPEAIRESQMRRLTLFMDENDEKEVINSYELIDKSSPNYYEYLKKYPKLADEPVYVLMKIEKSQIEKLNPIIGKAFISVAGIEQVNATTSQMDESITVLGDSMIIQTAAGYIKEEYEALGINVDRLQTGYIIRTGGIMLLIALISAASIVGVGFFASRTAAGLARNLREKVFAKVENFSKKELDSFSTASLITRTTNDITQIQMLIVVMIRMVFYAPIMGVGGIFKALSKNTSMSWIIGVAVLALLTLIITIFIIALPKFKAIQKLIDRLNLVTRENLSGMMVIRAFNTEKFEEKRFDDANRSLTKTNLFVNRVMVIMFPSMMLIMNVITILIVWVGAHYIANSSMQVGDMMAFMQYAMQIIMAFLMMSFMFIMVPRASVAANRIAEVLETEPEIIDPKEPKTLKKDQKGIVEFKNVSFKYEGAEENMLKEISFKALPGEITAFIGSTGSGKTTLVNLITRFYDVTGGQVLVNGVDVREVTQHDLRDEIGYVPQKSSLFSGTIESNLRYANEDATQEEIRKVVEIAQVTEFIEEKSEGLESTISQGGSNISGGQKQRLSIARALMKKPDVYIFDDSFSALDFKTDLALRKALKKEIGTGTFIIVALRVSTIMNAEQIIVLDEGKIVGKGTHKELMVSCPTYQEIALSQLSKEEL
jgi:ATP-binding cassette subfamily B protein